MSPVKPFHRVLTDPAGKILHITELGYTPSDTLRTAVEIRDGTCPFSTCNQPAEQCDLDTDPLEPQSR